MLTRPARDEHDDYYSVYIDKVPDGDILEMMDVEMGETLELLAGVPAEFETHRYEPGKWSIREVVGHMLDVERVFAHRALWFARKAQAPVPGMDQDQWAAASNADERQLADLAGELAATRLSNRAMFAGFDDETATRRGIASGCEFTVRAIAWILVGHEIHHRRILTERYL